MKNKKQKNIKTLQTRNSRMFVSAGRLYHLLVYLGYGMCMLQDAEPPCQNPYTVNAHVLEVEAEQYSGITTEMWPWTQRADPKLRAQLQEQKKKRDAAKIENRALKKEVNQGKVDDKEMKRIEKMKRQAHDLEQENKKLKSKKAALGL